MLACAACVLGARLEGKACDATHACVSPYVCGLDGTCALAPGEGEGEGEGDACEIVFEDRFSATLPRHEWAAVDVTATRHFTVERGALAVAVDTASTQAWPRLDAHLGVDLRDAVWTVTLRELPPTNEVAYVTLTDANGAPWDQLDISATTLGVRDNNQSADALAWDPATERTLRLPVHQGTLHFEVSGDGAAFTERATRPARAYLACAGVEVGAEVGAEHAAFRAARAGRCR